MFIVKNWVSISENDVFVFHGSEEISQDDTLYNDDFSKTVTYLRYTINHSDTILHIKKKISTHCAPKNTSVDEIYLWGEVNVGQDNLHNFITGIFKSNETISGEYLSKVLPIFFNMDTVDIARISEQEVLLLNDVVGILNGKLMKKTIGFKYTDISDELVLFNPDPFDVVIFNEVISGANILSSGANVIMYMTGVEKTINFCKKTKEIDDIYFPFKSTTVNTDYFNVKDEFMTQFNTFDTRKIDTWVHKTDMLVMRVLPYTHDVKLNLIHVFNGTNTNINMPMLIVKDKGVSLYKVHKLFITKIDKTVLNRLKDSESNPEYQNNRSSYVLAFFDVGKISFVLILSKNGSYKIKLSFNSQYAMDVTTIMKNVSCISNFIKSIGDDRLYPINQTTDIFSSPYVQISDYSTHNVISMKDDSIFYEQFKENIKKISFMFDVTNTDANIISLKFKEVSNFFNTDSVTSYIYKHRELNDNELVSNIQTEFNLSKLEAEAELSEKRNSMKIKVSKRGKNLFAIREFDTSISIKLNIMSGSSVRVITTNSQDYRYVEQIIKYISYLLTNKITMNLSYTHKPNTSPNEQDISGTKFEDILDNFENDFDLSAFDDTGLFNDIDEIPEINRETEALSESTNFVKEGVGKQDYTTHVLKRLQTTDPVLFKWTQDSGQKTTNYSGKCGAVNYRQPIVINAKEKANIDTKHPGSYTGFVQTGSTPELKEKNYYICPKIWCRVSRVSLTVDEFENKYNGVCPSGEEPLMFPKKGTPKEKNYFINRYSEEIHWPILMNGNKHPNNLNLPCCGKLRPKKIDEKKDDASQYVSKITNTTTLAEGKNGVLPDILDTLLNHGNTCRNTGVMVKNKSCFVRTGSTNTNQLMNILGLVLGVDDLASHICDNLTIQSYIFLNNGNTLRTFINDSEVANIFIMEEFLIFKNSLIENKEYVKEHNLQKLVKLVKQIKVFDLPHTDPNSSPIIRQFLIFRSFSNFKKYIISDLFRKQTDDVYHLFSFINTPNKTNVLFLEFHEQDVFLINSKYFDIFREFDKTKPTCIVVKIGNTFEYIRRLSHNKVTTLFNYSDISEFVKLIPEPEPLPLSNSAIYDTEIRQIILGMNFKVVGIMTAENKIVPFANDLVCDYNKLTVKSFVFMDDIPQDTLGDFEYSKAIGLKISKKDISELINSNTFVRNLKIFTYYDKSVINERNIDDLTYELSVKIKTNKKMLNTYKVITNESCHFTNLEKVFLFKEFLKKCKVTHDSEHLEQIIDKLLTIPIENFQTFYKNNKINISKDEVVLSQDDVRSGILIVLYDQLASGTISKKTTSDDNILFLPYLNLNPKKKKKN
jgi:hypothetical protein